MLELSSTALHCLRCTKQVDSMKDAPASLSQAALVAQSMVCDYIKLATRRIGHCWLPTNQEHPAPSKLFCVTAKCNCKLGYTCCLN